MTININLMDRGVKQQGHEADRPPLCGAEVNQCVMYITSDGCAFLGSCAASSGYFLPTFRETSQDLFTFEDVTDRLP
jgi:hypothetical protein